MGAGAAQTCTGGGGHRRTPYISSSRWHADGVAAAGNSVVVIASCPSSRSERIETRRDELGDRLSGPRRVPTGVRACASPVGDALGDDRELEVRQAHIERPLSQVTP